RTSRFNRIHREAREGREGHWSHIPSAVLGRGEGRELFFAPRPQPARVPTRGTINNNPSPIPPEHAYARSPLRPPSRPSRTSRFNRMQPRRTPRAGRVWAADPVRGG